MNFFKQPVFWISVIVLVVVVGGGFGVWRYIQITRELDQARAAGGTANAEEVKQIVDAVGKLMELSISEEPTVATVTDVEKLRDQPFFARAQNDDKVLIYTNEKRAILYRPSTNKIIDVAPVNLSESTASGQAQGVQTSEQNETIAIYNGTTITGLSRNYETELRSKLPNAVVVARETAANTNVSRTIIIDVLRNKPAQVQNLATVLGIATGVMPAGESTPSADFLIIVGSDKSTTGTNPNP